MKSIERAWEMTTEFEKHRLTYYHDLVSERLESSFAKNIREVSEAGYSHQLDETCVVAIPVSGGMDSLTLAQMAKESRCRYRLMYFDLKQSYAWAEIATCKKLFADAGVMLEIYELQLPISYHDYILSGRNAIIILEAARVLEEAGQWGEIWFGNTLGESPALGGDKSKRFLNDIQTMLTLMGQDVHIVQPLLGLEKRDIVRYWQERDVDRMRHSRTCFGNTLGQCGKCQACFLKWSLFATMGLAWEDVFPELDFPDELLQVNESAMLEAIELGHFDQYSPVRVRRVLDALLLYRSMGHVYN
jgi:7-cyano-7-deazaguanine synthase in queuosine biosynthesis